MSRRWILFVSARHFRTKRREKGHTAGVLSVLGIAAGVMTLISVLAVMNGFQFGTIEDILEVGSFHLQVTPGSAGERDLRLVAGDIADVRGVRATVPYAETWGLAYGYFPDPLAVQVRAVPPDVLDTDARLAENVEVVSGRWELGGNGLVMGQELARRLGVRVGDAIRIVGFGGSLSAVDAESADFELVGVFRTGFLEYDAGWAFTGLPAASTGGDAAGGVSPDDAAVAALGLGGAERIGVKLDERFRDRLVSRRILIAAPELEVESWRDYNRAIFGALRLEKTMMMLLVGLIFVVVAVNIYQSLRRSVVERTEEIGVLKALGAPPFPLQLVFVLEGLMIGLAGGATGLVLGLAVSLNINAIFRAAELVVNAVAAAAQWIVSLLVGGGSGDGATFSIFNPAYFYLEEVPAVVVPVEVVGVVLFAVASATVAAYAASRRVSAIAPADVLRYE